MNRVVRDAGQIYEEIVSHFVTAGVPVRVTWHGHATDVIALPHPSGASPWHKIEPGKALLERAMHEVKRHPAMRATLRAARGEG